MPVASVLSPRRHARSPCAVCLAANISEDPGPEGAVIYDVDGLVVKAYRVEYGGRVIGISGETVDTEGLCNLVSGADVLVSEVFDPPSVPGGVGYVLGGEAD